jgi:hypothetical protein
VKAFKEERVEGKEGMFGGVRVRLIVGIEF